MGVEPDELTGTERAVLLVLMAQARPVPNPDLADLGPRLEKPSRDKLNRLGLVESDRVGARYVHELTDAGWRLCRDVIAAGPPPRSTGPAKTLYTVLSGLERHLRCADLSLADVFGTPDPATDGPDPATRAESTTVDERIRRAYADLAPRPGGWVSLADLRPRLDGLPRVEVDTALRILFRAPGVTLIGEENQKVRTAADDDAAIVIGDQPKHLIAIQP